MAYGGVPKESFEGGGVFSAPASIYQTVNFGVKEMMEAPGNAFDAILQNKLNEQKGAREFLQEVLRSSPQTAPYILANTDLLEKVTETPKVTLPIGKKGAAEVPLGQQIKNAYLQAIQRLPQGPQLTPDQHLAAFKALSGMMTPEALQDPANWTTGWNALLNPDPNMASAGMKTLAAKGALKEPEAASMVDRVFAHRAEFAKMGQPINSWADAFNLVQQTGTKDLREKMLELEFSIAQNKAEAGTADLKDAAAAQARIAEYQKDITSIEESRDKKKALAEMMGGAEGNPAMSGLVLSDATAKEIDATIAAKKESIAREQALIDRITTKGKGGKGAPTAAETPEQRAERFKREHPNLFPGQPK